MNRLLLLILFWCATHIQVCNAQDGLGGYNQALSFPEKFLSTLQKKVNKMEDRIYFHSEQVLLKLRRREIKIKRKLLRRDSTLAVKLFDQSQIDYNEFFAKLPDAKNSFGGIDHFYLGHIDSIKTSVEFLESLKTSIPHIKNTLTPISKLDVLQSRLKQAEGIKAIIHERNHQLSEQLSSLGFAKELRHFKKQAYYYSAQIKEYRQILEDPKKIERRFLAYIQKFPAFQDFFRKHSEFSGLFRLPDDNFNLLSLQGLQARLNVQSLMSQRISLGGPNGQAIVQQQLQQAQAQLSQIRDRVLKAGGEGSQDDLPDFRPNNQRIKSFWSRLEYGTDIQSNRSNYYFPVTTDIGLSVGYQINDKSIIGIGANYKVGWGKDISHISISHQGVGFRSFVNYQLHSSFYASGGYEINYRSEFKRLVDLKDQSAWQRSGLIGMSKIVALKTKIFKKTKVYLLWDFLSYSQVPRTQPILFRIGYNF